MTILSILATIFGAIGGLSNIPQAIKIFKRKSAKDISILTYALGFATVSVWILYGIEIQNMPVILGNVLGFFPICFVIIGWFMYGRR